MSTPIGLIGLGNMGLPMARRLLQAGHKIHGFDLSSTSRERLAHDGGTAYDSASEATRGCKIIILMLPDSGVVESVVDELLGADAIDDQALLIDMSSSQPLRTEALHDKLLERGIALADAPVSGGVQGAETGRLTIMLGAEAGSLGLALPILEPLGRVVHCGRVGAGHAVKALNNLLSATHLWITSEAIEAGRGFGLDPDTMLAVFNTSSGRSGSTEHKWPNFILPGTFDSGFALQLMLKDMKIAGELADRVGRPSILGQTAIQLWAEAAAEAEPSADHTRVAEWIAERAERGPSNDG
ncbi:NAD(P)-dependent oxidoreductase [uncultured Agrococcus sp.]|uniref:NAD(P)-dependent oxidoreductase n=1 Tax=uncultured Agrococcus sp. TaxID=382258 RepID=UPI0025F3D451|nr:NAD(P)-dependent oxidoreductase [uncultured Agrococcus sp.]